MMFLDLDQVKEFALRPMTEHDLLEVVEIEEACGLSRWGWEGYRTELMSTEAALMVVARPRGREGPAADERIVGFIAARLSVGELHINNVAVREEQRRRGLGGALLAHVLELGRRRGAVKAFLEVRAANTIAQLLYARHGFEIAGRRARYYREPVEDALVMTAWL